MSTYSEKHREYYLKNRERILSLRAERERNWMATPRGKFSIQKRKAKQRKIPWELSFEEWWSIWEQSGRWDERGPNDGYVMCRDMDTGPYAVDNVRIDSASNNRRENLRICGTEGNRWKAKES